MQKKNIQIRKWVSWVFVVSWMGVIFYLSHQPGGESSALSTGVVQTILSIVEKVFSIQLADHEIVHFIVRKGAHVFAYFVLSLLLIIACRTNGWTVRKSIGMALVISILYAVSDEVHQLFIPGRSGQVTDVLIDTTGACIGIGMFVVSEKIYMKYVRNDRKGKAP